MSSFIQQGNLVRLLATLFLFLVVLGASLIVGYEIFMGIAVNTYAIAVVAAGVSYSLTLLGIHLGNGNSTGATL